MKTTLVLGGVRSGKSRYAERLALAEAERPVYLATSRIWDADHSARIARHRRDRGPEWTTIEEDTCLSNVNCRGQVVVVDCVTLWLTNLFVDEGSDPDRALLRARGELDRTLLLDNRWIFVSNEIGLGVHPPTEVGRKFADLQGFFNQYLAQRADDVCLLVAGLVIPVKGSPRAFS